MMDKPIEVLTPKSTETTQSPEVNLPMGLDGRSYKNPGEKEMANRNWLKEMRNIYISPWTGKKYTDFDELKRDDREYWQNELSK